MDCIPPLSMEFSKQEHWSGLPFPSPGDVLDPGNEPGSPALQADFVFMKRTFKLEKRPKVQQEKLKIRLMTALF